MARRLRTKSGTDFYLLIKTTYFYPSDQVNTKTTIPFRVGEERWIYTSMLRVSIYPPLFTSPSEDSCILSAPQRVNYFSFIKKVNFRRRDNKDVLAVSASVEQVFVLLLTVFTVFATFDRNCLYTFCLVTVMLLNVGGSRKKDVMLSSFMGRSCFPWDISRFLMMS